MAEGGREDKEAWQPATLRWFSEIPGFAEKTKTNFICTHLIHKLIYIYTYICLDTIHIDYKLLILYI